LTHSDGFVELRLLRLIVLAVERIQTNVVIFKLRTDLSIGRLDLRLPEVIDTKWTDSLLEEIPLLERQRVTLGNDRNDIDDLAELLHDDDVDGLQRVTRGRDEVKGAVNPGVLDVSVTHGRELLAQVGRMLVLNVLDDRVPAGHAPKSTTQLKRTKPIRHKPVFVVHQVSVAGRVNNVEAQLDIVLLDDCTRGKAVSRNVGRPRELVATHCARRPGSRSSA
jgi:hypothetical protein